MNPEELQQAYWTTGADAWGEAHEYWSGKFPKALSTGWPEVDKYYKVAPGQITILGGIPNHGKSTFLDALLVNLVDLHKFKVCIYSPENHPVGIHAWNLIDKYTGTPMLGNGMMPKISEADMAHAGIWLDKHFRFLTPGTINSEGLMHAATLAHDAEPFDALALDPWNEFGDQRPNGITETEWVSITLGNWRRWARERGVHLFIVVHPRKLEKDQKGAYPVPTAWDLAGSAHWRNKADAILTYWRDFTQEEAPAELHVQKVRFNWVGRVSPDPIGLIFHPAARTFTAVADANNGNYWQAPYAKERKNVKP
jgi:twinkle protein